MKHVMVAPTSDHWSRALDTDMILFQPEFVMTMSVTLCRTDHRKKSHDIVIDQALVAKVKLVLVTPIILSIISDYHNSVRDADMEFVSVRFFMTLTVIFCSTVCIFCFHEHGVRSIFVNKLHNFRRFLCYQQTVFVTQYRMDWLK